MSPRSFKFCYCTVSQYISISSKSSTDQKFNEAIIYFRELLLIIIISEKNEDIGSEDKP